MNQHAQSPADIDINRALIVLRVNAIVIAIITVLGGAAGYGYSKMQRPVFAATTTLLSAGNQTANQTVNSTLVSAPPLPQGALEKALASTTVLGEIRDRMNQLEAAPEERARLKAAFATQAAQGRVKSLSLRGRLDFSGNGTYDLTAEDPNPAVAAALANLAANVLVDWDTRRGLVKVSQSRAALEAQLRDVDSRLARAQKNGTALEQQTLLGERSQISEQLNNIIALERAVSGTLSVVAPAVSPISPVRPRPTRTAALAALFALIGSAGLVLLRANLDRTLNTDEDVRNLELRLLAEVPRIKRSQRVRSASVLPLLRRGAVGEAISFLRTNLNTLLAKHNPKIILLTSPTPGEGKSSISAALADAYAVSGKRVLLIDADLHRPNQETLWGAAAHTAEWVNLPGAAPFPSEERRTLVAALRNPEGAQAKRLRDHLHFVPAGASGQQPGDVFTSGAFAEGLKLWSAAYDVVIVDGPPTLLIADPLIMAPATSGVLLVVEAGRTPQSAVRRAVDALTLSEANLVGIALNKVDPRRREGYYGQEYYAPRQSGGRVKIVSDR